MERDLIDELINADETTDQEDWERKYYSLSEEGQQEVMSCIDFNSADWIEQFFIDECQKMSDDDFELANFCHGGDLLDD